MRIIQWIMAICLAASSVSGVYAASGAHENQERPDIEIWLGEGIGRYGDRQFSIRGGSAKNPTPTGALDTIRLFQALITAVFLTELRLILLRPDLV